jgi:outer membrane protein assembly factor BamA
MYRKLFKYLIFVCVGTVALAGCSTTKRLADGQVLYTGVKRIEIEMTAPADTLKTVGRKKSSRPPKVPSSVKADITDPLSVKPNNPLWSPYIRTPLPTGLWVWNSMYTDRKKGFKAWVYRTFGKQPVLMEQVQPEARTQMIEDILDNLGYFGSEVSYEILPAKNPKKVRVSYSVRVAEPWFWSDIECPPVTDTLTARIAALQEGSNLKAGLQYNVDTLTRERIRITNRLREESYYYFRPDYIEYFADSTRVRYGVDLKMRLADGIPAAALQPYNIGNIDVTLLSADEKGRMDSMSNKLLKLRWQGKLQIRPRVLQRAFAFKQGDPARISSINRTLVNLTRIGIFRYVNLEVPPLDSLGAGSPLDVKVSATFDTPMEAEIELDFSSKSNSFLGPALTLGLKHKNLFKGGETFSVGFNGSYEWQTGNKSSEANASAVNSYEVGLSASITYPRLVIARFIDRALPYGGTTSYSLDADLLNRPHYFRMLSASFSNTYDFRTSRTVTHSLTPFKMVYNNLLRTTDAFEEVAPPGSALRRSFDSQFIPSGTYTYTFDKQLGKLRADRFTWQLTLTTAGNVWAGVYGLLGVKGEKRIFGLPFAQFFKETTEVKYFKQIAGGAATFAARFFAGAGHPYGNSKNYGLPYTEQFSIGGAYSIRAFTIRSIGPGSYQDFDGSYLNQTGEFKLELNAEMRFRIAGGLNGAVFFDAGNVWMLRDVADRPDGTLKGSTFWREIATGTGAGLRYDLGFLVLRADLGIGIHLPYETSRKGYYNIPRFKDGLGFHLAIGYPF